jgi:hypothetical protein
MVCGKYWGKPSMALTTKSLLPKDPKDEEMASAMFQVQAMSYQELKPRVAVLEYERRVKRDELAEIDREIYEIVRRTARVECPAIAA